MEGMSSMDRIVIWDDSADDIYKLEKGITKALLRASLNMDILSYQEDWFRHAKEEVKKSGNQLWLVDIVSDTPQLNNQEFIQWMTAEINSDPVLKHAYDSCFNLHSSHPGIGIGIFANHHGIPIRFESHFDSSFQPLISILVGTSEKPVVKRSENSFQKNELMMDINSVEYDRIVDVANSLFNRELPDRSHTKKDVTGDIISIIND